MTVHDQQPRPPRPHRPRSRVLVPAVTLVVLLVSTVLLAGCAVRSTAHGGIDRGGRTAASATGRAGGETPRDASVFDDSLPAVNRLDPGLLSAVRHAAEDAADDDVDFVLNSGWRSAAYQDQLLRDAVDEYGSIGEAARWVATSETSAHVRGDAVDIGSWDAATWLSDNGAAYGLCQVYGNEGWHFELRPEAVDEGCPRMFVDPTQDPRMQR
ncbi:M15 family metallopeptidase [Curtobacterium sp. MCLR17_032]|uniref:M15 family metallopeptidase n=1 Tax=Curtobacterium sp. MCLR17_032 TaxID=2175650 RepID=UPI000DA6F7CB|nr:M15 family metallopeptidase [Curtobacterium sp. MCLR17_032]WIE62559.1 M15 family metallopeptidase [Curtobacterium sp. MCLR17_032]